MITLNLRQTLILEHPSHKHRYSHLSAASGLVQVGDWLYVVADDENHIGVFSSKDIQPGILKPLLDGKLPIEQEERKEKKPDLETLAHIPPSNVYPQGALMALGSGSKKNRCRGAIIALNSAGAAEQIDVIDLDSFYDFLKADLEKINIEGLIVTGQDLLLFHRGNKKNNVNSIIRVPFDAFYRLTVLADKKALSDLTVSIQNYDLGSISNVPLCFTDATLLPDGTILFTATAENTGDAYLDGTCMGSSIGIIDSQGRLRKIIPVDKTVKIEGISARLEAGKVTMLLVTDADNASIPAHLFTAELKEYPVS